MSKPRSCNQCKYIEVNYQTDEAYCTHEKTECEYLNYYLDAHRHKPKNCPLNKEKEDDI